MRQIANRQLWIGHAGDLNNPRAVLNLGIQAVVELADNEQMATLPRDLIRCPFPINDGDEERSWLLRMAAETTAALLRERVPTLVCCSFGVNRSVCIAAAGISIAEGIPLNEAVSIVVGTGPADVSPALLRRTEEALRA
jgi:protein-tyrosine phosphatase